MNDSLDELRAACATASRVSDQATLDLGETGWLRGHPAPATPGTVALWLEPDTCVVIRESDIVTTRKDRNTFSVRVKKGSPILCRFESVARFAEPVRSDCGCRSGVDGGQPGTIRSTHGGGGGGGPSGPVVIAGDCRIVCKLEWTAVLMVTPDGGGEWHYYPTIRCEWQCTVPGSVST